MSKTDDLRIGNIQDVANAATIMSEIPISDRAASVVASHRAEIHRVLQAEDDRLVVVTGPCSIHDPVRQLTMRDTWLRWSSATKRN